MGGLIIICAVLAIGCLALLLRCRRLNKRISRLTERLDWFHSGLEAPLDVALGEDPLSQLHNGISDLQQGLLREKRRRAEECSRTSRLTADISHQLKTPLTTLRLYTELDCAAHMEGSLEQIQRMENLIQALLRLERLRSDGYAFCFAPADAEALVREQWESLQPLWPRKTLEIEGSAHIRCDRKWLGEAFGNLLKNACEHTGPEGRIHLRLDRTEAAFFCTLEDDGGGVPAEALQKLFQRFYRAEHQSSQGAGIGLAIVKEIIARHHGTISAENGIKGLKMVISLPMLDRSLTNL